MTSAVSMSPGSTPPVAVTAEGEAFPSDPRRLRYVEVETPRPGEGVRLAPGVIWARIPLPMDLNHINVWLVDAGDGWIVVDTGMAASIGKDAWEQLERETFAGKPLRGVFVTHIHPDHIGLAAWLQERHRVPVWMSKRTHELARIMLGGEGRPQFAEAEAFFRSHGMTELAQIQPLFKPERFARMTSGMPQVVDYVADGQALQWGSGTWKALQTDGHAEGHLCLWNEAAGVLISGDQVLPTISSNISFTFRNGDPNPLGSYLGSLQRLRTLPHDTLVLPSHGLPFQGLQYRIDDLTQHHEEQLEKLVKVCSEPRTAAELLPFLYRRELIGVHLFLALGEALAHVEYLVHAGRLQRRITDDVIRYAA